MFLKNIKHPSGKRCRSLPIGHRLDSHKHSHYPPKSISYYRSIYTTASYAQICIFLLAVRFSNRAYFLGFWWFWSILKQSAQFYSSSAKFHEIFFARWEDCVSITNLYYYLKSIRGKSNAVETGGRLHRVAGCPVLYGICLLTVVWPANLAQISRCLCVSFTLT